MTNEQKQVKDWMLAAGQECPDKPTIPDFKTRKLRVQLMYEEFIKELSQALGVGIYVKNQDDEFDRLQDFEVKFCDDWSEEGPYEEDYKKQILKDITDGCEDLKVVTEGTLVACGLIDKSKKTIEYESNATERIDFEEVESDEDPLFNEVMRSNNSKFWTEEEFREHVDANINNPNWIPHTVLDEYNPEKIKYIVIKDLNGKVQKSPHYEPPNLQPIIEEMSR